MKKIFLILAILTGVTTSGLTGSIDCMAVTKKTSARKGRVTKRSSNYTKYTGTVGKYKVTVFLDADMNGYYYYGNGSKGNLKLHGEFQGGAARAMNYYLYEYNSSGDRTAVWDVWINPYGVSGTMTTNGKTFDVELR